MILLSFFAISQTDRFSKNGQKQGVQVIPRSTQGLMQINSNYKQCRNAVIAKLWVKVVSTELQYQRQWRDASLPCRKSSLSCFSSCLRKNHQERK